MDVALQNLHTEPSREAMVLKCETHRKAVLIMEIIVTSEYIKHETKVA